MWGSGPTWSDLWKIGRLNRCRKKEEEEEEQKRMTKKKNKEKKKPI